jgi:hypothetical protein
MVFRKPAFFNRGGLRNRFGLFSIRPATINRLILFRGLDRLFFLPNADNLLDFLFGAFALIRLWLGNLDSGRVVFVCRFK